MADDDPYKTEWGGDYASDKPREDPYKSGVYKTSGSAPSDAHGEPESKGNTTADSDKKSALDRNELSAKEKTSSGASGGSATDSPGLFGKHDNQVGKGYKGSGKKGSWASKNRRKLLLAGAGSSIIILPIFLFLAILLPSLKLPQLAAEIEGYRLARLSRTFYKNASTLMSDRAAIDASGEAATMEDSVGKTTLGRAFNTFRPNAVISNMKANGTLGFDYSEGAAGTQKLSAVILKGESIDVPKFKYTSISDLKNSYSERVRFAAQIRFGVDQALDGSNYFVRSSVSKAILKSYGINLLWWEKLGSEYRGTTEQEADRLALRQAQEKIETPDPTGPKTAELSDAEQAGEKAQKQCLDSDPCTDQEIADNGMAPSVEDAITKATTVSGTQKIINFGNPTYAALFPICLAFDGSADLSSTYLNSQNAAALKTFFAVASASDQEKSGDVTAEAVGAMNRQIGDIATSIPGQIAQNGSADTSAEVSPQAGPSGEFTVFNALFDVAGIPGVSSVLNLIGNHVCPIATDPGVSASIAAFNLLLLATGLGEVEDGAETAASQGLVKATTSKILSFVTTHEGRAAIKNTAKDYAASAIKTGAASEGLTYLSRMIVLGEMGSFISGMDSGDFANQADMGGEAYANQMEQTQQFGRPLTPTETTGVEQADQSYTVATQDKTQSTYQKYFAISNPYSVMGNIAMRASGWKFSDLPNFFTNIPKFVSTIFSPLSHFGIVHAASTVNSDYGMVQFGWSNDEEDLIDSQPSYDPLINAQILADSGTTTYNGKTMSVPEAILDKYGVCFGVMDDGSGNAVFDPNDQIGNLLTGDSPDIDRDSNGNVIENQGTCSPDALSYKSSDSLAADNDPLNTSPYKNDLIFRWRLDQAYQNTLNELLGAQNPTADSSTSSTPTTTSGPSDISAYQDPLRAMDKSANFAINRVDQGVDYAGSGPIYALGNGIIDYAGTTTGWPGGNFVSYKLTDGPAAGREVYVAEDCVLSPNLVPGVTVVTPNTVICTLPNDSSSDYFETGWAASTIDNSIDEGLNLNCYDINNSTSTVFGMNFSQLLGALGVPGGNEVDNPITCGPLPSDWPTW